MTLAARLLPWLASTLALAAPFRAQELAGRVMGSTGEPVAGALVIVLGPLATSPLATTGHDGAFSVSDAPGPPGNRSVFVHRADLGWIAAPLPPPRSRVRVPWVLTLADSPPRLLHIRQADGAPAARAWVRPRAIGALPPEGLELATAVRANEQGEARCRVREGEILVIEPAEGTGVQVRVGTAAEITVDLPQAEAIVRGRFEPPAAGFTLVLAGELPEGACLAPGVIKATSTSAGSFAFKCARGDFHPSVITPSGSGLMPPPAGWGRQAVSVAGEVELVIPLVTGDSAWGLPGEGYMCMALNPATKSEPVHVVGAGPPGDDTLAEPITLQGRVFGSDGVPARAWIRPAVMGQPCCETLSRSDGTFSVVVFGRGSPVNLRVETQSEGSQMPIMASEDPVVVHLDPDTLLPVRARLVDGDGRPVAGARVRVVQQLSRDQIALEGFEVLAGTSDADGFFTSVPGALDGDQVTLRIEGAGFPGQTHAIPVSPLGQPPLNIHLAR